MKFTYEYRTSDNARHTGVVEALDREAAFQQLREKGIKPGRLTEAPGFFNHLFGKGKRWITIGVLGVGCLVLGGLYYLNNSQLTTLNSQLSPTSPLMRRQIYGDPALMEELARSDYATIFATEADRFLARYAQPAVVPPFPAKDTRPKTANSSVDLLSRPTFSPSEALDSLVAANYQPSIAFDPTDSREVTELKRIVLWMRDELRDYLANGLGTPESYAKRLNQRLKEELMIYNRVKTELSRTTDEVEWEKGNATLRAIGAPTIPRPE